MRRRIWRWINSCKACGFEGHGMAETVSNLMKQEQIGKISWTFRGANFGMEVIYLGASYVFFGVRERKSDQRGLQWNQFIYTWCIMMLWSSNRIHQTGSFNQLLGKGNGSYWVILGHYIPSYIWLSCTSLWASRWVDGNLQGWHSTY